MNQGEDILIHIILYGKEYHVNTHRYEYPSLMALIEDRLYPDNFGECGGQGRCATCRVQLDDTEHITSMDRNENSTLEKQGVHDSNIRLSCQLLVDESLHHKTITVIDDY